MKRILALDQASRVTGWAVYDNGQLVKFGKIDLENGDGLAQRLVQLRARVLQLIQDYNINFVIMEDIQEQNNIQTFKALAEVYGVLEETFKEFHIPYSTIYASEWKSICGVRGRARAEQKRNAQAFVETTFGVRATQDESDAICIGFAHINEKNSAF